jgi:hypothetical protein
MRKIFTLGLITTMIIIGVAHLEIEGVAHPEALFTTTIRNFYLRKLFSVKKGGIGLKNDRGGIGLGPEVPVLLIPVVELHLQ